MSRHPSLYSLIDKAVFDYGMICPGDRILVGASGGKDSTALACYLSERSRRPSSDFTFAALNIKADFAPPLPPEIAAFFREHDIPLVSVDVDTLARLKPGFRMNCWWCSTQRRTELLNYAVANGFNKIALGHHLDDILETLLMNMLNKGTIATMPPEFSYRKYPVTIIRPLCYASERTVIDFAQERGFGRHTCTCSYQDNSGRKEARRILEVMTGGDDGRKQLLFRSMRNIKPEYLP